MGKDFATKLNDAIAAKRETDPLYGLRTIARELAKGDKGKLETYRRQLYNYRPKTPGGAAATPKPETRHEIEDAMGLERDALAPDMDAVLAARVRDMQAEAAVRAMDALRNYMAVAP